jgi:hypothetical protein
MIMKRAAARITLQAVLASLTAVAMLFVADNVTNYRHRAIVGQAHADDKVCSLEVLKGVYAVYGQGNVLVGTAQEAQEVDIGLIVYDGNGGFVGDSTFSLNGKIIRTKFAGTYRVTSDCTATAIVKDDLGEVLHEEGVILGDGAEVRFIGTDPGAVVARVARRLP